MGGGGFSMDDHGLDRFAVDLTGATRPKICFLPTASGDALSYILRFYEAFPSRAFDTSVLRLFERDVADVGAFLGGQDLVYVGGGNTASMLAIWRLHGVDLALRAAWEAGVVMAGVSAGANCWFEASTTDSFLLGRADPLRDGLGLVPGSFTPHYDGEASRRPSLQACVGSGELPAGFACDDYAAVHLTGTDLAEAVASRPGARAYLVRSGGDGSVIETVLETHDLGAAR
jgi:dipeptidase E